MLHAAILSCYTNGSQNYDVVMKLVDVGGSDLVLQKDMDGITSLHYLCSYATPNDVVMNMIEVGGEELVLAKDNDGWNSLFYACCFRSSNSDLIMELIQAGGRDVVVDNDHNGENSLFIACKNNVSMNVLERMIDVGGQDILLTQNKYDKSPLYSYITHENLEQSDEEIVETIALLISRGIHFSVCGEFGIGGLFNSATDKVQKEVFRKWSDYILPALQKVTATLDNMPQPVLHAALISKVSSHVVKDIVQNLDCIETVDSMGRYPIDLAIKMGLPWNDGMKEIVEAFASAQGTSVFNVSAKHRLPWENGMENALKDSGIGVIRSWDELLEYYPYILAGEGPAYDLEAIFNLMKRSPGLFQT